MNAPNQTKTYRGRTLEELLPQIRAELGPTAVITRRREGVHGGVGGFFGKRMVEVEACAGGPVPALPGGSVIDAYDTGSQDLLDADESPVMRHLIGQSSPFAAQLDAAADRLDDAGAQLQDAAETEADELEEDVEPEGFQPDPLIADPWLTGDGTAGQLPAVREVAPQRPGPIEPAPQPEVVEPSPVSAEWQEACEQLVELGMPRAVVEVLARDAERSLRPFLRDASPQDVLRRTIARHVRIEHGWRTKRRTIALVGPAGAGKTTTAAKLCHAYALGSPLQVRAVSLEPASAAYRLGSMIEHLNIDVRVADSAEEAAKAARRTTGDSLIVVDTPAVSQGDLDGIAGLAELLSAVRPDETHLVLPASFDARATAALYEALSEQITINRILISRMDEAPSAAVAVGSSLTLKRPVSYVADGRKPSEGLRPAEPAELAELVLP